MRLRDDAVFFFVPLPPLDDVCFFVAVFFAVDFFVVDVDFFAPVDLGVDFLAAAVDFFAAAVLFFVGCGDDFPDVFLMGCTSAISPSPSPSARPPPRPGTSSPPGRCSPGPR